MWKSHEMTDIEFKMLIVRSSVRCKRMQRNRQRTKEITE